MEKRLVRLFLIVGVLVLIISSTSILTNVLAETKSYPELGSFDFVIRTGGRLQEPDFNTSGYPLGHSVASPGNVTISPIEEFREFSIFYQFVLGIELLENGSQIDVPVPEILGAEYDIHLDLSTVIEVEGQSNTIVMSLDNITNFHLSEETSQRVILPKGISMGLINSGTQLEFLYYKTETDSQQNGFTSDLVLTQDSFTVDMDDALNVSFISDWSVRFNSSGTEDTIYSDSGNIATFQIQRNVDSSCRLSGEFVCYFYGKIVAVETPLYPVIEVLLVVISGSIVVISLLYIHKKND